MSQVRFRNLDALRGLCAVTVMLFHCDGLFTQGEIFCHGFLSVDVFFILSGFVLAHTYEDRLRTGLSASAFTRLRLKRLAPVYWTGTLLGAGMMAAIAAYRPEGTFFSPFLIAALSVMAMLLIPQVTLGGSAYPANAAAWSLAGELIVNVLYARWFARWRTAALAGVIVCLWLTFTIVAFNSPYGWGLGGRSTDVWWTPVRALPAFLMGVVLFRAWRAGWFTRFPAISPIILLGIWVAITEVPTHGPLPAFEAATVTLVAPLLIVLLVRTPEVAPKPFLWLGAISYPLYAVHLSLVYLVRFTPLFGLDQAPSPWRAALVCAGVVLLGWIVHRLVERPRGFGWITARSTSA